ncbi:MAG: hypothetical protein ACYTKC_12690, partial [Planctomycetota bacterium]
YTPAIFQGGFIWDDDDYVQKNEVLRTGEGLALIWTEPMSIPQWYPLVHTTFWVEFQWWGLNPLGYHLTNVLIHIASTVLLFFVLRRLAVPGALLAAAVFGLHPVMVESVAWITERKNVLSLFCYLAALLCYLRFERLDTADRDTADPNATAPPGPRPWKYHALALVLFACALLSKTVTCSMPAVVLLLIYWKRGRIRWPELWPTLPLFAVAVPLALYTAHLEEVRVGAVGPEWDLSLAERVLVAGRAIWFYAHKLVWPGELVFIYERWQLDAGATWQWVFPVGVVVALVGLFLRRHRIGRGPVVAACIFCGTLTPALGFFSVYPMRYSFVADHFQYHASIALIALLTAALVGVFPPPGESLHLARKAHKPGWSVAVLVLAGSPTTTWRRSTCCRTRSTTGCDTCAGPRRSTPTSPPTPVMRPDRRSPPRPSPTTRSVASWRRASAGLPRFCPMSRSSAAWVLRLPTSRRLSRSRRTTARPGPTWRPPKRTAAIWLPRSVTFSRRSSWIRRTPCA